MRFEEIINRDFNLDTDTPIVEIDRQSPDIVSDA